MRWVLSSDARVTEKNDFSALKSSDKDIASKIFGKEPKVTLFPVDSSDFPPLLLLQKILHDKKLLYPASIVFT
jgi:hypothetical protein